MTNATNIANGMQAFQTLAQQVLRKATEGFTFNIKDVETKVSKNGNIGYRVTCTNGTVISFFHYSVDKETREIAEEQLHNLIDPIDNNGTFQVLAGCKILDNGSVLPLGTKSGSFWD